MFTIKPIARFSAASLLILSLLVLTFSNVSKVQAQTQPPNDTPTPEGLSADDWAQIQASLPVPGLGYAQDAYVKAPHPQIGEAFGSTVAISGDTVVVGTSAYKNAGVYVFVRSAGVWKQ